MLVGRDSKGGSQPGGGWSSLADAQSWESIRDAAEGDLREEGEKKEKGREERQKEHTARVTPLSAVTSTPVSDRVGQLCWPPGRLERAFVTTRTWGLGTF